jgi:membrane-bound serine protease (ClpP class)
MILVGAILLAVFVLEPPYGVLVVALGALVEVGETLFWVWLSRRRRVQVGAETLIGASATVVRDCRPLGLVRLHGELWQAHCAAGAGKGATVRVAGREGLTLLVEPE